MYSNRRLTPTLSTPIGRPLCDKLRRKWTHSGKITHQSTGRYLLYFKMLIFAYKLLLGHLGCLSWQRNNSAHHCGHHQLSSLEGTMNILSFKISRVDHFSLRTKHSAFGWTSGLPYTPKKAIPVKYWRTFTTLTVLSIWWTMIFPGRPAYGTFSMKHWSSPFLEHFQSGSSRCRVWHIFAQ